MSENNKEKLEELFKAGWSYHDIAKKLNVSIQTIIYNIKKIFPYKTPGTKKWVNDTYFDNIDTEEKAYLLGFFVADGCVREEVDKRYDNVKTTRMALVNSIDDQEIINKFHELICPHHELQYFHNKKGAKNRKPQISIQWTSYHMSDILINKYKIIPRKTYDANFIFPFETISKELRRHFIRGFMDGDGSINWTELKFVFTSESFAKQIINEFRDLFVNISDPNCHDFSYTLHKEGEESCPYYKVFIPMGHGRKQYIMDYLYRDSTIYLDRKFKKANTKLCKRKKKS